MAYDDTPAPERIADDTIAALDAALLAYVRDGVRTSALRLALARLSSEAREKSLRPEKLLVLLKERWAAVIQPRHAFGSSAYETMLRQLVTLCIDEYYGER
ncbi:MAG: hypothetical protein M3154_12445 [Candidatus Eremiobacteraeota bacterium]|nr:hypothetical protein [Candidatus Eremiobacteraeota bacterium]